MGIKTAHKKIFGIKPTSLCNGFCNDCSIREWMNKHKNYQLSIGELENFLAFSSKVKFELANISGGEPLCWINLAQGLKIIRESGIFNTIRLVTNGIAYEKLDDIWDILDYIIVSKYLGNEKAVTEIIKRFGRDKVRVYDGIKRKIPTSFPIENSLPANCGCLGWCLIGNKVWACAPAETIIDRLNLDQINYKNLWTNVKLNYLSHFDNLDLYNTDLCSYCMANAKVNIKLKITNCKIGGYL